MNKSIMDDHNKLILRIIDAVVADMKKDPARFSKNDIIDCEVNLNSEIMIWCVEQILLRYGQFKCNPDFGDLPITVLDLSTRTANVLIQSYGVKTVGELMQMPEEQLKKTKGLGAKCLSEIKFKLKLLKESYEISPAEQ